MLLARLAYPNRLSDLALKFGWPVEHISRISTTVQSLLHDKWKHLLEWDTVRLTPEKLLQYAQAVKRKGAPIDLHKHCLKYHTIVTPDGLISHLFGPVDGQRNDSFLWHESNLPTILQQHAWTPNGTPLQVYGDPAYNINQFLLSPYQGARITQNEQQWNCSISCVWIVAEWAFKEMVNTFGFLDYVKNQKHLLQPVGVQFRVAALLHNAHVCLHKPQVTQYFDTRRECRAGLDEQELIEEQLLEPPTLLQYFHNEVYEV
ncbi:hypothetical protein L873DRAFT_1854457 [Choiromyces venosus 120613-1]|uniref:DDE Tnp4 domain-containing protein n=1 Tax=Choiromyces venosus 120613-1 TaxID=1336337 RepID=A0A3N4JHH7_9PEZI|nr:hypothetical protein L873DRAFT_1854457 [Choiromyces venosus 120613-1]